MAAFTFKHGDRPLEGYAIQRGVGRGGFGEVYYSVSDGGREVALKYLRDNPDVELRGVSHCMNLKSPHLVTIFDVKQNADGEYFIVMEYVQGPSLRDLLIAEPNGLGPQKAAFFIRELAKGLGYLHDRGIVHRDMKPGNIFYEDGYVKIGDYGLSKFISVSRHSAQTASVGTVHYMAPEVGSGNYHRGIDIYALGVMLYEMLLGRVPYEGVTMGEVLMKHLTAQPEVDELPEPFGRVIRKALAKDPKDRYQTVDEMADDLLGVEEVKDSLAGFDMRSLSAAAHAAHAPANTPILSPNPPPPPPPPPSATNAGRAGARHLPGRLEQRFSRIGEKFAHRGRQVDWRHGRRGGRTRGAPLRHRGVGRNDVRHSVVAVLLVVGIAVALMLLTGMMSRSEKLTISAGFGVMMMSAGVFVSRKIVLWLGPAAQPGWVRSLIKLGCCGPLLAFAMAPVMEVYYAGSGALLALVVTTMLVDWERRLKDGAAGEMKIGQAFSAGLCALVFTAFLTEGYDQLMFMAAGVAAATSFAVQGVAWFMPLRGLLPRAGSERRNDPLPNAATTSPGSQEGSTHDADDVRIGQRVSNAVGRMRDVMTHQTHEPAERDREIPMAIPVERNSMHARLASGEPLPPLRHIATRAVWSVVGFVLLAGAVVSFLSTVLVENVRYCSDERQIALTICAICCAMLAFVLRKITMRNRPTFWKETLRPLLLSLTAIGIIAPIVALLVQYGFCDEERLALVTVSTLSGVLFILLLFVARGRRTEPAPFLIDSNGEAPDQPAPEADANDTNMAALDRPEQTEPRP